MYKINLNEYDYGLPDERIAQHPEKERDRSKLLLYAQNSISADIFKNIDKYIPSDSLLVFNNTRVIRARLLFRKESGAKIELLCLEPLSPAEYELSLGSKQPVEWKCIIGNLKRWKSGLISQEFGFRNKKYILSAEKINLEGEAWRIRFWWNNQDMSFSEVIEATGHIPLPPYIKREDEEDDNIRYQTVYSLIRGSVAAPTAGLHFTPELLDKIKRKGIGIAELTLHIGAGTFKPVKTNDVKEHEMHTEHFIIERKTIESLLNYQQKIIPVGTTTVRSLESLYWLGVKTLLYPSDFSGFLTLGQWEAYKINEQITVTESLEAILHLMLREKLSFLCASTKIMIIPGYDFKIINGLITNFHQPRSTLLLLISAWVGNNWKRIYEFALDNKFRFLSYGDSSLLFR